MYNISAMINAIIVRQLTTDVNRPATIWLWQSVALSVSSICCRLCLTWRLVCQQSTGDRAIPSVNSIHGHSRHTRSPYRRTKVQYTPPTPTKLNCRVESRRRCLLGLTSPYTVSLYFPQRVPAKEDIQEAQLLLGDRATRKHAKDS